MTTQGLTVSAWLLFVNGPSWREEGTYVPVKSCAHDSIADWWVVLELPSTFVGGIPPVSPASQGILQRRRELQSIGYGKEIGS